MYIQEKFTFHKITKRSSSQYGLPNVGAKALVEKCQDKTTESLTLDGEFWAWLLAPAMPGHTPCGLGGVKSKRGEDIRTFEIVNR
ncbi:hypothetical protein DMENIID0001_062890 [Sergentomyia squamirostris]